MNASFERFVRTPCLPMNAAVIPFWAIDRAGDVPFTSDLRLATKQSARFGMGGDFFEVVEHGDGRISMVVADVCGNGPSAARIANRVSLILHGILARGESPGRVLGALNDRLVAAGVERFVTAVAVRVDLGSGLAQIACAGHLGPFVRRTSGRVRAFNEARGVPLGLVAGETYGEISEELESDDALILVTDGITDPLSTAGDPLGERGLLRQLSRAPHVTASICHALLADGTPRRVDATVLAMQLPARDGARIAA
jgi:serine phosphatase RsbU (regulator of sigma subunit)